MSYPPASTAGKYLATPQCWKEQWPLTHAQSGCPCCLQFTGVSVASYNTQPPPRRPQHAPVVSSARQLLSPHREQVKEEARTSIGRFRVREVKVRTRLTDREPKAAVPHTTCLILTLPGPYPYTCPQLGHSPACFHSPNSLSCALAHSQIHFLHPHLSPSLLFWGSSVLSPSPANLSSQPKAGTSSPGPCKADATHPTIPVTGSLKTQS